MLLKLLTSTPLVFEINWFFTAFKSFFIAVLMDLSSLNHCCSLLEMLEKIKNYFSTFQKNFSTESESYSSCFVIFNETFYLSRLLGKLFSIISTLFFPFGVKCLLQLKSQVKGLTYKAFIGALQLCRYRYFVMRKKPPKVRGTSSNFNPRDSTLN